MERSRALVLGTRPTVLQQCHAHAPLCVDVTRTFMWEVLSSLEVTFGLWDTNPKGTFQSYPHTVFKAEAKIKTHSLDSCLWPPNLECIKHRQSQSHVKAAVGHCRYCLVCYIIDTILTKDKTIFSALQ